jgi:hypothetical protein
MATDLERSEISHDAARELRFEGFKTPEEVLWKEWLQALATKVLLPFPNLDTISYDRTDRFWNHLPGPATNSADALASVRSNPDGTKTLRIRKKLPPLEAVTESDSKRKEELRGVFIHEVAHLSSPFDRLRNADLSPEERKAAEEEAELVHKIAVQCLLTGVFLTGYHLNLQEELITDYTLLGGFAESSADFKGNSSSFRTFREETWAELVRLRYTDPAKLRVLGDRQKELVDKKTVAVRGYEAIKKEVVVFSPLLTPRDEEVPQGVDKILCRLTGSGSTSELESVVADAVLA